MIYDLVFEGGGAKGMVFVGALQEFEDRGHTSGRLLGTSAGAITAAGLAAGYSAQELLEILNEKQDDKPVFASFMADPQPFAGADIVNSATLKAMQEIDIPLLPNAIEEKAENWIVSKLMSRLPNLFSLVERGGWYSADNFITWLERIMDTGIYPGPGPFSGKQRRFSGMTMSEFHAATHRELSVIAADTSSGRMVVLNHQTAPDLPVVWAVRMSMSIPMVWPEVVWQAKWGKYLERDMTGHLLVDGGLLSNFPIELFISSDQHVSKVMGKKQGAQIMGLLIDESLPVANVPEAAAEEEKGFNFAQLRTVQRITRLIDTLTGAHDKMVIEAFEHLVVRLPAAGYGTVEFDMDDDRREALLAAGRATMATYLDSQERMLEVSVAADGEEESFFEEDSGSSIDPSSHADHFATKVFEY